MPHSSPRRQLRRGPLGQQGGVLAAAAAAAAAAPSGGGGKTTGHLVVVAVVAARRSAEGGVIGQRAADWGVGGEWGLPHYCGLAAAKKWAGLGGIFGYCVSCMVMGGWLSARLSPQSGLARAAPWLTDNLLISSH